MLYVTRAQYRQLEANTKNGGAKTPYEDWVHICLPADDEHDVDYDLICLDPDDNRFAIRAGFGNHREIIRITRSRRGPFGCN